MLNEPLVISGYYVMTWGGGRYGVTAWYAEHYKAYQHAQQLLCSGQWSGLPPTIYPTFVPLPAKDK